MQDVVTTASGSTIRVLYRYFENTTVNSKYLVVAVRELNQEGFIVTTYFADNVKRTKVIWKRLS